MYEKLSLTVMRDYGMGVPSGRYEYLLWDGDVIVQRQGMFPTYAKAKREALKIANSLLSSVPR
jgi:hypothetical protein